MTLKTLIVNRLKIKILVLLGLSFCFFSCKKIEKKTSQIDFKKVPFATLEEYHFFTGNIANLKASTELIAYKPASELFSDYSHKSRFVWMPKDSIAKFPIDSDNSIEFPDHTFIIKNFYYPENFRERTAEKRILETRILFKENGEWMAYPYHWNKEQNKAELKIIGGQTEVNWKDNENISHTINYSFPNKNQCKSCHNKNEKFSPIGLKVKQLNNTFIYPNKTEMNQIDYWQKIGKLENKEIPADWEDLFSIEDKSVSLELKARSYLDVNCAHCHSQSGPASTSGLYLNIEEKRPFHWGVFKSPVAAGIGAGNFKYAILPGKGNESILTYRMNSTHPGIMMPEIGRVSIHKEGVELINNWINSLNHNPQ